MTFKVEAKKAVAAQAKKPAAKTEKEPELNIFGKVAAKIAGQVKTLIQEDVNGTVSDTKFDGMRKANTEKYEKALKEHSIFTK